MADFYDVNAAIQKPNIFGALQQGIDFGQQQRAMREQRADEATLRQLAPQIMGGDFAALEQAAAIDPTRAAGFKRAGDVKWETLKGGVQMVKQAQASGKPEVIQRAWSNFRPYIQKVTGVAPPENWAEAEPHFGNLEMRLASIEGGQMGEMPTDFRSRHMMLVAANHLPGSPEYQRGMAMGTGLIAREVGAAAKTGTVRGADGLERPWIFDPNTRAYTVFDGTAWRPMGPAEIQQVEGLPSPIVNAPPSGRATIPPADFAPSRVGGAADEDPRIAQMAAYTQALRAANLSPEQLQAAQAAAEQVLFPGGFQPEATPAAAFTPTPATVQPAAPNYGALAIGRSPEEQARLTKQAETDVQIANAPTMATLDAEAERQKALAKATAEAQARDQFGSDEARKNAAEASKKIPQLGAVGRGVDRIENALTALNNMPGVDTGPLDQYVVANLPAGQELTTAANEIQGSMLALVRVPGVGSQSDLEARVAAAQYPSVDKYPEVNARTMINLRALYEDLKAAYDNVIQAGNQRGAAAPSSGGGWSVVEVR